MEKEKLLVMSKFSFLHSIFHKNNMEKIENVVFHDIKATNYYHLGVIQDVYKSFQFRRVLTHF